MLAGTAGADRMASPTSTGISARVKRVRRRGSAVSMVGDTAPFLCTMIRLSTSRGPCYRDFAGAGALLATVVTVAWWYDLITRWYFTAAHRTWKAVIYRIRGI